MVYNRKTQRKRSKSASKSRSRRGGDIEDGKPASNVSTLMKPPNRTPPPTYVPPTYIQTAMKSHTEVPPFDVHDAAEKGLAGPHLLGGRRRKGRRTARRGKRSKRVRRHKKTTKKKSLFGQLFGL